MYKRTFSKATNDMTSSLLTADDAVSIAYHLSAASEGASPMPRMD